MSKPVVDKNMSFIATETRTSDVPGKTVASNGRGDQSRRRRVNEV